MDFTRVDGYLLGEPVSKKDALDSLLSERSPAPAAAPFYRALDAVGPRAADEALIALRLVLAGQAPSDERVRRLRALSSIARAARNGDQRAVEGLRARDAAVLGDLPAALEPAALEAAAREAFTSELR